MLDTLIMFVFLVAIGFLIGLLVSLWGSGGGGLYVPLLILGFGIVPQVAVATSLVTIIPVTAIGSLSHRRERNLNVKIGLFFVVGGLVGVLLGVYLSSHISGDELKKILGFFLIGIGILMAFAGRQRIEKTEEDELKNTSPKLSGRGGFIGVVFGVASGLMTSLVGSSGTPPTMAGLYLLGYPVATVVGTSVFVTLCNATAAVAGHIWVGQFDLTLTLLLCIGSSSGAFVGPKLLSKIQGGTLERIYGPAFVVAMIAMGLAMLL